MSVCPVATDHSHRRSVKARRGPDAARLFMIVSAFASAGGSSAHAQALWVSVGGGTGPATFSCRYTYCVPKPTGTAATISIQAGLTAGQRARWGVDVSRWSTADFNLTNLSLAMRGTLHRTGFFVQGGLGYAWMKDDLDRFKSDGLAYLVGVGLQPAIGRHLSLGPIVTYRRSLLDPGDQGTAPIGAAGWRGSLWVFGAAIAVGS